MKNILSLRLKNFLIVALLATLSAPFASANTCIDLLSGNRGILPGLALPNNPVTTDLYFTSKFDQVEEHTLREGKVAAHLYIDTTKRPYFFFAFPAGNTGIGLWFNEAQKSLTLTASAKPRALAFANKMWGVEVDLRGTSKTLNLSDSVLGSMRFVRDRELDVPIPTEVQTRDVTVSGNSIIMKQTAINGMVHYVLEIQVLGDTRIIQSKGKVRLSSPTEIQFTARASTDEKPLTPTPPQELFKKSALEKMSQEEMDAISFLFYKEKLAAGSPRYLTNFGRDRMVTLRVLMDILTPEAAESILSAMLGGSHPTKGWMSHEQHEADFASFVRRRAHKKYKNINDPIEDRSMVDDDFLFTIVFGEYAKRYPERLQEFLNGKDYRGLLLKQLVLNNFQYVAKATEKFTTDPNVKNLIRLKKGHKTGQWRDSEMGLGGGVYPFDVNAAIVPGALKTLTEFYANSENPLRDPSLARFYAHSFEVWNSKVLPPF